MSLPPRVSLNDDHLSLLGQQSSPGKHLQSVSLLTQSSSANTVDERAANKATESVLAFKRPLEKTILAVVVMGELSFCREEQRSHHGLFVHQISHEIKVPYFPWRLMHNSPFWWPRRIVDAWDPFFYGRLPYKEPKPCTPCGLSIAHWSRTLFFASRMRVLHSIPGRINFILSEGLGRRTASVCCSHFRRPYFYSISTEARDLCFVYTSRHNCR